MRTFPWLTFASTLVAFGLAVNRSRILAWAQRARTLTT